MEAACTIDHSENKRTASSNKNAVLKKPVWFYLFVFLVYLLHGGEEDDLADGVVTRQQHHAAVNTHAHAARGRHAVRGLRPL